jgi:oligoribonuclease (3'-5' exoribonuclease)
MKELFLDLETSGVDPDKHSILSIGIVVSLNGLDDYQSFYREIKYDELVIMPRSISINKFNFTDQTGRIPLFEADEEAEIFVRKYFHDSIVMPVGLNVGEFDMQFIRKQMPKLAERLSHRTVNLNGLIYILAEKHSRHFDELKKELSDKAHETVQKLGLGVDPHNALYDSVFNLSSIC